MWNSKWEGELIRENEREKGGVEERKLRNGRVSTLILLEPGKFECRNKLF